MKTPLFLFITLFLICMFSGCKRSSNYYHSELPCGKVNGEVKKVTDTVYTVSNGDVMYPLKTVAYCFDSCYRLVEEQYCSYSTEETGEDTSVSVCNRVWIKNRYDLDGRKVESHTNSYRYEGDRVLTASVSMHLTKLDGDCETWEICSTDENDRVEHTQLHRQYRKDSVLTKYSCEATREEQQCTRVFDGSGNVVAYNSSDGSNATYIYNAENQLVESLSYTAHADKACKTHFQMDEFDNAGNWLKRVELDEHNEINYITRRKIEYKIGS